MWLYMHIQAYTRIGKAHSPQPTDDRLANHICDITIYTWHMAQLRLRCHAQVVEKCVVCTVTGVLVGSQLLESRLGSSEQHRVDVVSSRCSSTSPSASPLATCRQHNRHRLRGSEVEHGARVVTGSTSHFLVEMDFGAASQQKFPAGKHPRLCIEICKIDGRICVCVVVGELTNRPRSIGGPSCTCMGLQPWRCIWAGAQPHQPKARQLASIFIYLHKSSARMHQLTP